VVRLLYGHVCTDYTPQLIFNWYLYGWKCSKFASILTVQTVNKNLCQPDSCGSGGCTEQVQIGSILMYGWLLVKTAMGVWNVHRLIFFFFILFIVRNMNWLLVDWWWLYGVRKMIAAETVRNCYCRAANLIKFFNFVLWTRLYSVYQRWRFQISVLLTARFVFTWGNDVYSGIYGFTIWIVCLYGLIFFAANRVVWSPDC